MADRTIVSRKEITGDVVMDLGDVYDILDHIKLVGINLGRVEVRIGEKADTGEQSSHMLVEEVAYSDGQVGWIATIS